MKMEWAPDFDIQKYKDTTFQINVLQTPETQDDVKRWAAYITMTGQELLDLHNSRGMLNRKMACPRCGPRLKEGYKKFCKEIEDDGTKTGREDNKEV